MTRSMAPPCCGSHRLKHCLDVADGVGAASMAIGRVVDEAGHVVVDDEAVEADLLELADHDRNIAVPLVDETFGEVLSAALHVAKVDVEESVPRAEVLERFED